MIKTIFLSIIIFLISLYSNCQTWKEPFDTLEYLDNFEKLTKEKIGIKSYTITQFDSRDSIQSYEYYKFNKNGYLIEQLNEIYPNQNTDTIKYKYENGIVQGDEFKREHIFNEKQRLIEIRNSNSDSIWSTNYIYKSNLLVEIRYSNKNSTIFQYNSNNKIKRKIFYQKNKIKKFINYSHLNDSTITYCDCNLIKVYNDTIEACDSTIGVFNKRGNILKIELYFYKDKSPHLVNYEYDRNQFLSKITYIEPLGIFTETYFRNQKGLITKIEFRDNKSEIYLNHKFKYEYY